MTNAHDPKTIIVYRDQAGIIVLLCGGDKDSQRRDIQRAQEYWKEYQSHD